MSDWTAAISPDHRRALAQYFDPVYYLAVNPDVAAAELDPLEHYYASGWHEGRNPSRSFNTLYYLLRYPDIADAGINPLLHFALVGKNEGRLAMRPLDAWRRQLDHLPAEPPPHADEPQRSDLLLEAELRAKLENALCGNRLIVSISHDDYATNTGGIQNLIADEQAASTQLGWQYLHISPLTHRVGLAMETAANVYQIGIRLNRDWIGYANMATLLETLVSLRARAGRIDVVIHHMMAHAPELLREIVRATGCNRPLVWVHDFFTVCPSYTLMRNDVVFCGGPPPGSSGCAICYYGGSRGDHLRRISEFFQTVKPVVLAPSESMLKEWRKVADLPVAGSHALPLGRLFLASSGQSWALGTAERPLRIAHIGTVAHVGARNFHKGWPVFEALALRHRSDERYKFFQFGRTQGEPPLDCIRSIDVNVTRDTRRAMIEALSENNIDVVVNWTFWPETFCFAAYEAVASGAFVITHEKAGNVPRMVLETVPGQGLVLADQEALFALFDSDALRSKVLQSRRRRGALMLSSGTIGWLENGAGSEPVHVRLAVENFQAVDA